MFFNPFILAKNSLKDFFGRFFNVTGRLNRVAYITVFMIFFIFYMNVLPLFSILGLTPRSIQDITALYITLVSIIFLFASIRRIHDVGFSVGALMVFAIPGIGVLAGIALLLMPSDPNLNRFGPVDGDAGLSEMIRGRFNRQ